MDRPGWFAESLGARLVALALVVLSMGCTMCPDPYDYSGPVPNGSAPQNDFRARSNGILPLGGSTRPWPPLVGTQSGRHGHHAGCRCGRHHGSPTLADPAVTQASVVEPIAEDAEPQSVLVAGGAGIDGDEVDGAAPGVGKPVAASVGDDPAAFVLAEEEPAAEPTEPGPAETPAEIGPAATGEPVEATAPEAAEATVPRLAETPGWRPRQAR